MMMLSKWKETLSTWRGRRGEESEDDNRTAVDDGALGSGRGNRPRDARHARRAAGPHAARQLRGRPARPAAPAQLDRRHRGRRDGPQRRRARHRPPAPQGSDWDDRNHGGLRDATARRPVTAVDDRRRPGRGGHGGRRALHQQRRDDLAGREGDRRVDASHGELPRPGRRTGHGARCAHCAAHGTASGGEVLHRHRRARPAPARRGDRSLRGARRPHAQEAQDRRGERPQGPRLLHAQGERGDGSPGAPGHPVHRLQLSQRAGERGAGKVASGPDGPADRTPGGYGAMPTYLISRYSSMPSKPPSRPKPECLTPPKGAAGLDTMPWLMPTIPNSRASLTRSVRERSRVNTYATRPYSVSLARAIASASVVNVAIGATGPKISSRIIRASAVTPVRSVGA